MTSHWHNYRPGGQHPFEPPTLMRGGVGSGHSWHPAVPSEKFVAHRVGGWLPQDHRVLEQWLKRRIAKLDERTRKHGNEQLADVLEEFKELIESDPVIYMGFHQMFEQVPMKPPYCYDPTGKPQVRDYKTMLGLFDDILKSAPEYEVNALVGFPINAIIDWPMGTPAGYSMFTNDKVNAQFQKVFKVWCDYLISPASREVLTTADNGWFGPAASIAMPNFIETYICDPDAPYRGFTSWDDFFTRSFRPGVRTVEYRQKEIITSACESTIYGRATNVKERDRFWLKGQPYSLADILHYDDTYVSQFVGGTVYQAFLAATKYHRWHSPVDGTIFDVVHVPGTYYAESPAMGFDPAAPDASQAFITAVATRALVYIQADYEPIGLMCFVAIGMSEVSSCEVTVGKGDRVSKGDEIGMFHFGGSSHCLIFRPETKVTFPRDQNIGDDVLLHAPIATIG
ncbi:Phophatidylserine decarboxylase-domain-containing protein [Earliella scabrosa]|nr:Phophatidylserine decarboxylase-domain-containing protein [Earliella scabrosa]